MGPGDQNPIFGCSSSGDIEGLRKLLGSTENESNEESTRMLEEKDVLGRNALFTACMHGRAGIVQELVKYGLTVNSSTVRGYTPLHCAALWGHLETVKTLVELGADIQSPNFRGEKAKDVACRYSKTECADYLTWAEAKQDLHSFISQIREIIADPEKVQGKLNKEDKNTCLNSCLTKSDWIQNAKNATAQDFVEQKKHLEEILNPILAKLRITIPEPLSKTIRN
ncbi:ankyrin repeat domain-containing protein 45 [Lepisosteus oculatus]|uniref:ankyrin repeat domain-containing protein 45 n=1 Tax=Lepisosteus oculatus TaxID=7918 RepID=UPI003711AE40